MITRLVPEKFDTVRDLFADLAQHHLFAEAVLNHDLEGHIYVDDETTPKSGFMTTKELQFLAGNPNNSAFNASLQRIFQETIFVGKAPGATLEEIDLVFMDGWLHRLETLFGGWRWPPVRERACHYHLTTAKLAWRELVPSGYTVQKVDVGAVYGQVEPPKFNINLYDNFSVPDFGFCAVWNGRIVCLCFTDVMSGSACEIGIETDSEHYRRGLATVTAAATVEYALAQGYQDVWWICNDQNRGSIRTAEKVGFTKAFESNSYFFIVDEEDHERRVNL